MALIIICIVILGVIVVVESGKVISKRCWDAEPGAPKVHTWVLRDVPGSLGIVLVCKVCGQKPGEE
jgi:hypothetical protein